MTVIILWFDSYGYTYIMIASFRFHRNYVSNASYQVDFMFGRTSLQLMHRAIEHAAPYFDLLPFDGQPSQVNSVRGPNLTK